ncbi:MAG: hypothetical protein ACT4QE_02840 [Anaerolineales bacterium]
MQFIIRRLQRFVKRYRAEQYMLALLIGFALSVSLTRFFLALTGYPQIGNATLHIAHLLWGGLLLFVATLLLVLLDHRRVYWLGAILSGVGVGLFIDEIGKFITRSNDYFYPMAAPIIYAFFLLTVLVYLFARRPPARDPRSEMYRVLDLLKEVLDRDLNESEWVDLRQRLRHVAQQTTDTELARLAQPLLQVVESGDLHVKPDVPTPFFRVQRRMVTWEKRWFPRPVLRRMLAVVLAFSGVIGLFELIIVGAAYLNTSVPVRQLLLGLNVLPHNYIWVWLSFGIDGAVGLAMVTAALLLVAGREWRGVTWGYFSLLITLTTGNLFSFYFNQFSMIANAAFHFIVLIGLLHYRRRYLGHSRL